MDIPAFLLDQLDFDRFGPVSTSHYTSMSDICHLNLQGRIYIYEENLSEIEGKVIRGIERSFTGSFAGSSPLIPASMQA